MSRLDGGPAFPGGQNTGVFTDSERGEPTQRGMTLRDYFAKGAMEAECIHQGLEGRDVEHIAAMAYELADAMLKARGDSL